MPQPSAVIHALVSVIEERNPMHRAFLQGALAGTTPDERTRLERYVEFCLARGLSVGDVADAYLTLVHDTLREQIYFRQHGAYRHTRFVDVAGDVYFNPEYMCRYMVGLCVSAFLWPNHRAMFRFYAEHLPRDHAGAYLEIGPGHGYYVMTAMQETAYDRFTAIDLSTTSLEQTRDLIAFMAPGSRCELRCEDFLTGDLPLAAYDAIVMGEVLEHVEDPQAFLDRIAAVARPGAFIFITTCINGPAVDHIMLFRDVESIEALIAASGLAIQARLLLPYEGRTLAECTVKKLAVNVAYVLERP